MVLPWVGRLNEDQKEKQNAIFNMEIDSPKKKNVNCADFLGNVITNTEAKQPEEEFEEFVGVKGK